MSLDVGGVMDAWAFPVENPVVGWALSAGVTTIVGPVSLQWARASDHGGGRLSIGVGRVF